MCKVSVKVGEYAESLAIALLDRTRGTARVIVGATDGAPLVLAGRHRRCWKAPPIRTCDDRHTGTCGIGSRLQSGETDHARHHRPAGRRDAAAP